MRQALKLSDMAFLSRAGSGGGGGAPSFLPTDVADLYEWIHSGYGLYQDTSNTTPITADGQSVKSWLGTKAALNPQDTGFQPPTYKTNIINGLPAVQFNGTTQALFAAGGAARAQPQTMLFVAKMIANGAYQPFFDGAASNRWFIGEYPSGTWDLWISSGSDINVGSANTNWNIWAVVWNGASSKYGFNTNSLSTVSGSPGTNSLKGISMATETGGHYGNCYIAEFMWYDGIVSVADIGRIVTYLGTKYAISVTVS